MSFIYALIIGLLQGLCEFFPISSSAHLRLLYHFLSLKNDSSYLMFELICNMGTMLAAAIYLRKQIIQILFHEKKQLLFLSLAIIPLIPMYIFFKPLKHYLFKIELLGFFFIITSSLLFLASFFKHKKELTPALEINSLNKNEPSKKYTKGTHAKGTHAKGIHAKDTHIKDILFIGCMQTLALIPGISRSGSTISAACFRRWHIKEAITFSFLLAIPTILGGNFLEAIKFYKTKDLSFDIPCTSCLIGFFASFFMGMFCLKFIFSISCKKKLRPFAWYCLTIGLICLIYFNFLSKIQF